MGRLTVLELYALLMNTCSLHLISCRENISSPFILLMKLLSSVPLKVFDFRLCIFDQAHLFY